ncbi:DUF1259 domain-containing protein [Mesorhizobium sp. M1A.F.Ca.ET.072.01.1.1]|uniref:DUF1259 domain-containing protein n=1 Tax=Mesorhizobium sp. M1A.F.Ca.ET.072.01.1.1 TaxID=2496753 RepID=UPI000FD228EA|nr:DUF1259 domain-containing protein [Mesorhizobium sp. M1A.F.Ca.ET.072.01.1.1]RUW46280.1 DUF1259 domain-containing protein [Mesorhizobium sp. M1A.F.Ca.ET.072.01.1.1]TIU99003.1 MAG: DUF1259 domain-containing protein [Mesorhizobium sp.]
MIVRFLSPSEAKRGETLLQIRKQHLTADYPMSACRPSKLNLTAGMRRKAELVPFAVTQICDLVLIASDVNSVLKALRESGIEVTSVHNQPDDEPRLFSIDFWANGDCRKVGQRTWRSIKYTSRRVADL